MNELSDGELNLPKHMAEHVYMFTGESIHAKFKAKNYIVDQLIDWFGVDIKIEPIDENECMAEVKVNKEAFFLWALQYGLHVEVVEPIDIRERIIDAIKNIGDCFFGNLIIHQKEGYCYIFMQKYLKP